MGRFLSASEPAGREPDIVLRRLGDGWQVRVGKASIPEIMTADEVVEEVALILATPPAPAGEATGAPLLSSWLNSAAQQVRDSYVQPSHREDARSVDAAWQHYDPDGFALAVATREYLARVGYALGPDAAPQDATGDATTEEE